jgi:enoyl-CoA hydratase/carnithine racemase
MAAELLIEREDKLTRLILNRPDKRNALSADLVAACSHRVGVACALAGWLMAAS